MVKACPPQVVRFDRLESECSCPQIRRRPEGAKPVLTTILAVIGAVTGVAGLVLQAIAVWQQDKPKYSIKIIEGDRTYTVDKLSREEYLSTLQRLNRNPASKPVSIKLSRREKSWIATSSR